MNNPEKSVEREPLKTSICGCDISKCKFFLIGEGYYCKGEHLFQMLKSERKKVEELEKKLENVGLAVYKTYKSILSKIENLEQQLTNWKSLAGKLENALERYVGKFGNCGDTYDEAKQALAEYERMGKE